MIGAARARATLSAVTVIACVWSVDAAAQRPWWLLGPGKSDEYVAFEPADKRVALEIPKRDWGPASRVWSGIVGFSSAKSDASAALEHIQLKLALEPSEITQLFVDLEVESIKERDPSAEDVRTALRTDSDGRRVIVIDFTHRGLRGPERVRQFSIPRDSDLFRLICSAAPALFDKYSPVFEHMAASFKIGPGTPVVK